MGVLSLSSWENIRVRARAHGESIKSIVRSTGHSKNTIRKYIRTDALPKEPAVTRSSVLTPFTDEICEMLRTTPKLTSARVIHVLQERHDIHLAIKERAARKFVARYRQTIVPREAFVRLVYQPAAQLQIDFKDIMLDVDGEHVKHHLFSARLSFSAAFFGKIYRTEDGASLLDGILSAYLHFGGMTIECVFDNAKTAVTKVLRGRKRQVNESYAGFMGALGVKTVFAAPAKGNEKGGVEGIHGYIEDNFFRPMRSGDDLSVINVELEQFCLVHPSRKGERYAQELAHLHPLPEHLPSPARIYPVNINKFFEVTFATNRYSVPSRYAHREGDLHVYPDRLEVVVDHEIVAKHTRSFKRRIAILNPLHFFDVLTKKHRAVEHAEVFTQESFPQELKDLLEAYVQDDQENAGRNFMRIMELYQTHSIKRIVAAVMSAKERGTKDAGAITLLLEQEFEMPQRVPLQRLEALPQKYPKVAVELSAYSACGMSGMLS